MSSTLRRLARVCIHFQVASTANNIPPPHALAGTGTATARVPENCPVASALKASRYPFVTVALVGVAISVNEMLAGVGSTYDPITPPV